MEKNSLVVILPLPPHFKRIRTIEWLPIDNGEVPYVVRDIVPCPCGCDDLILVFLEEGYIGSLHEYELGIPIEYVKEIQTPGDLEEILSVVQESELIW